MQRHNGSVTTARLITIQCVAGVRRRADANAHADVRQALGDSSGGVD